MEPRPPTALLQALRRHRGAIARFALAFYALFVASAVASVVVEPGHLQMVCSGTGGMMVVSLGDDPLDPSVGLGHDCPLCAAAAWPLPAGAVRVEPVAPLAHALRPVAAAWIAWVTAPPLPSRGPPAASA